MDMKERIAALINESNAKQGNTTQTIQPTSLPTDNLAGKNDAGK
jgi:hypothetical protein